MDLWQPDRELALPVAAWFDPRRPPGQRVVCMKLVLNDRVHLIKQFDLYHQTRKGEALWHLFSVADRQRHYRLRFDSKKLIWTLEGIYERD